MLTGRRSRRVNGLTDVLKKRATSRDDLSSSKDSLIEGTKYYNIPLRLKQQAPKRLNYRKENFKSKVSVESK